MRTLDSTAGKSKGSLILIQSKIVFWKFWQKEFSSKKTNLDTLLSKKIDWLTQHTLTIDSTSMKE